MPSRSPEVTAQNGIQPAQHGGAEGGQTAGFTDNGVRAAAHAAASGGATAGYIESGDWAGYSQLNTSGAKGFSARISSAGAGGTITVRSGSQTGPVLGTVPVPRTGGWETFQDVSTTLSGDTSGPLFLSFTGGAGALFDVDTLTVRY